MAAHRILSFYASDSDLGNPLSSSFFSSVAILLGSFCVFATPNSIVNASSPFWRLPYLLSRYDTSFTWLFWFYQASETSSNGVQTPTFRYLEPLYADNGFIARPLSPSGQDTASPSAPVKHATTLAPTSSRLYLSKHLEDLEHDNAVLRVRIQLLEDDTASLRDHAASFIAEREQLLALNQVLTAERSVLVMERDGLAAARESQREELEKLNSELGDVIRSNVLLLVRSLLACSPLR